MRLLDESTHRLICVGEALEPSQSRFSATTWEETGFGRLDMSMSELIFVRFTLWDWHSWETLYLVESAAGTIAGDM